MRAYSLIISTLLLAMLLSIARLPVGLLWLRPEFVLLVLIYWALALPQHSGFSTAFFAGLVQDSLTGSIFGSHAIVYLLVVAFILFSYQRLRMLHVWQQSALVFVLLLGAEMLETWFEHLSGHGRVSVQQLLPAILGGLLWPWLMAMLRSLRRKNGLMNNLV
jgi:rod shape-determining protein MreD